METAEHFYLRKATEIDAELTFVWANDPVVRKNEFYREEVSWATHKAWLRKKLQNPDTQIFIFMKGEQCVGQLRIEHRGGVQVIDYLIGAEYRRRGYGYKLLALVESCVPKGAPLLGQVMFHNQASAHLFQKLGYKGERNEKMQTMDYRKFAGQHA